MGSLRSSRITWGWIGVGAEEQLDRLFAVSSNPDLVGDVRLLQRADREQFMVGIVFDEQDQSCSVGHATYPNVNQKVAP